MAHDNPLATDHLLEHVSDQQYFEVPRFIAPGGEGEVAGHLSLDPIQFYNGEPLWNPHFGVPMLDQMIQPFDLQITKFMILEVIAAVIVVAVFAWLGSRVKSGNAPKGRLWNLLETMLLFIRDEVARPAIGKHDADRFLPFLWTVFFFILACNLMGMVPWAGSPTGSIAMTGAMAMATFAMVVGSGISKMGLKWIWDANVPHMDLPAALSPLKLMIFAIEVLGLLIKHSVLAVRLFANMMAGHLVLAVLLIFILIAWNSHFVWAVVPSSVLGASALSLLELFVAFLQAYIFTFLSALFIGASVHPH